MSKNFEITNFSIFDALYNFGRVKTQKKIFSMISNFDVFMIWLSKPALDFNFTKTKKNKPFFNNSLSEDDQEIIFPNYTKKLIGRFLVYMFH